MKKLKKVLRWVGIFFLAIALLFSAIIFFAPEADSENFQFRKTPDLVADAEVIIIFNSGGWGYVLAEEAEDFSSIIEGIQELLKSLGYSSRVISYNRTENTLLDKAFGFKDFLNRFRFSSEVLAGEIEILAEKLPDKKIIITGLSFGGSLTKKTMGKISQEAKVYAIAVGIPFWHKDNLELDNILQLDNNGEDSLAKGEMWPLIRTWTKAPFKWIFSRITGENITFAQAIQAPGHEYFWSSSSVSPKIIDFIEENFKK